MLFISMGIFDDDFHPEILSVGTTANSPLIEVVTKASINIVVSMQPA